MAREGVIAFERRLAARFLALRGEDVGGGDAPGAAVGARMWTERFPGRVGTGFWCEIQDYCTNMEEPRKQGKRPLFFPYGEAAEGPEVVNYRSHSAAPLDARACGSALLLAAFDLVIHGLKNRVYAEAHALPRK